MRGKIVAECRAQKIECQDPWPSEGTQQKARDSAGSPTDEAARLYELAKTELYAGRLEAASRLFEQSLSVHPTPSVQFGLATVDVQRGCSTRRSVS